MKKTGQLLSLLLAVFMVLSVYAPRAEAVLNDFGPLNFGGYPAWYRDNSNQAVQQCISQAFSPVTGLPICGLLAFPNTVPPFDPTLPVTFFPNPAVNFNWPLETFYFSSQPPATFRLQSPGAGKTLVLLALEGSFANNINPVPGDQIVFSRVRINLLGAPTGRYMITHPFGVDFMNVIQSDAKTQKFTRDIGLVGIRFTGALSGDVGPFLKWTPDPALIAAGTQNADGTIPATNPLTGAAEVYLGDPNITHAFTGSPFGTNFWRIDGPAGSNIGGPGIDFIQSNEAVILGQKFTAPIPSPLTIERATYARAAQTGQIDIFAKTTPLSNQNTPAALSVSGDNITTKAMTGDAAGNFYANVSSAAPNLLPQTVTVTNSADVPPTAVTANLVDEVTISKANYDLGTSTLVVQASSADKLLNPALTVVGLGPIDPASGTLSINLLEPPPTVTVQSSARGSETALVITRNNIPPIANDDSAATTSATALIVNVIANDTDPDGLINPATVTVVSPPTNGTAVAHQDGTVTYTSNAGFVGTNTFTYTVQDFIGAVSNAATVTISVALANLPPVAVSDSATTLVATPVTINVIANDRDPDGFINPTSVNVLTQPANGTAIANANGTVTYTPAAGFTGSDTFNYVVSDNQGAISNSVPVSVTVNAANALPAAVDDIAATSTGLAVIINVLINDTPPASLNPASVLVVTAPANGTSIANANGSITYTSIAGFAGSDTFTYSVNDTFGNISNPATVTVTVVANSLPVANDDNAVTSVNVPVTINALANDVAPVGKTFDPTTIVVTPPDILQGTTTVNTATGAVTFTPASGFTGTSTFTYTVQDNSTPPQTSNSATVTITVTGAALPPVAGNDIAAAVSGVATPINVLANDTAPSSIINPATVAILTQPLNGTAIANASTGLVTYTSTAGFVGNNTFTYSVKDLLAHTSNTATVAVSVSAPNASPTANPDSAVTTTVTPVTINVIANDNDPDGTINPATVFIIAQPANGSAAAQSNGTVIYTATAGFTGTDTFTYTVKDNLGAVSNTATATVTVNPVATVVPPTALNDTVSTNKNTNVTFSVVANDSAAAGKTLNAATVFILTQPATGGTATANGDGTVTFAPTLNFVGTTSFTYNVRDNQGTASNAATVTVTVLAVNIAPVAQNTSKSFTGGVNPNVVINLLPTLISDVDGTVNPATVIIVTPPANGSAVVNPATGAVTYTPNPGFVSPPNDTFTYTAQDNLGAVSNIATVTVTVNAPVVEAILITRAQTQLANFNGLPRLNWRVDGTTTARINGENVFVFNSPAVPVGTTPANAINAAGYVMTSKVPVDQNGVWSAVLQGGPDLNAARQVSILTTLGNKVENIPMVVR
jgi:Bacterial Ig domain